MGTAIGIDIGGTFIDLVVLDHGRLRAVKVPSTPDAPEAGVLSCLADLIARGVIVPSDVERVAHGSTVATNALLEGRLAKTALITTRGFRDVLEIGRQNRPSLYDLFFERPSPIVPRDLCFEVRERVDARGAVLLPLEEEDVQELLPRLAEEGVEAIAVSFLFSFLNPIHERRAREILEAALDLPVTLSSDLLPECREYERTSTTVVSAALRPVIGDYLFALEDGAKRLGLGATWQVMQSSGSVARAAHAQAEPARIILSGPAAGVEGARAIGRLCGSPDLITLDMGGTSCDVSLIRDGEAARTTGGVIGGHPIAFPMVDIHTIGAGGGSIAWLDPGGALRVGPRSAGASPGPACYDRGGKAPTVTDAHLVLGHLLADHPLGGLDRLDLDAAREAVRTVSEPLRLSIEQAALGILEVADSAMERAIRVISIERGHDPRAFSLLAFGGAGPLHAVFLARRLSIPHVIVPAAAGVLSALGLLAAEIGHDLSQGLVSPLRSVAPGTLHDLLETLRARGERELLADGVLPKAMRFRALADLRYLGQSHEITIPLLDSPCDERFIASVEQAFHEEHRLRYGHAAPKEAVEIVSLRLRATAAPPPVQVVPERNTSYPEERRTRAWFDRKGPVEASAVWRDALEPGAPLVGPAIVQGEDATTLVPPGIVGRVDPFGSLILEVR